MGENSKIGGLCITLDLELDEYTNFWSKRRASRLTINAGWMVQCSQATFVYAVDPEALRCSCTVHNNPDVQSVSPKPCGIVARLHFSMEFGPNILMN